MNTWSPLKTGKMAIENSKHGEYGFCFFKTQGIVYVQVVDSLILKIRDISISFFFFFLEIECVCPVSFTYETFTNH